MIQRFGKLVALFKELFQLDQPDLDFGFYRLMHAKSAEVTQFLEKDLLPPSHVMRKQWGIEKPAMVKRHILFQDEDKDSYIGAILRGAAGSAT